MRAQEAKRRLAKVRALEGLIRALEAGGQERLTQDRPQPG
jgi:hypothetical protein